MAVLLTYYYPHIMAVAVLGALAVTPLPAKVPFFLRELLALLIAIVFAHLNRWFDFWPAYRYFASGHFTFCLGTALSLGLLRNWTLFITLPLLVPFGTALVLLGFHTVGDVLGAIPIVLIVYGTVRSCWPVPGVLSLLSKSGVFTLEYPFCRAILGIARNRKPE